MLARRLSRTALVVCTGLLLGHIAACSTSVDMHRTALSPNIDRLATLAIAPLEDLSGNATASPAVTAALANELRRRGRFQVVELDTTGPGATERWTASKLGKDARADAVLVGVVTSYDYDRVGGRGGSTVTPAISIDLRLVSSKNAEVLWAAAVDAKLVQLFSADSMPLEQLAQTLAEKVADALVSLGGQG